MRKRRPVLGTISGLVFGVFLALDLVLFGIVPLDSAVLVVVPVVGLLLGILLGVTSPLGRGERAHKTDVVPPEAAAQAVSGDAPAAVTTEARAPARPDEPPPPPPPQGE